jgi:hypothetical protein
MRGITHRIELGVIVLKIAVFALSAALLGFTSIPPASAASAVPTSAISHAAAQVDGVTLVAKKKYRKRYGKGYSKGYRKGRRHGSRAGHR